jgi:hypothetical protein
VGDKFYFQEPTLAFYKVIIRSVFQNHLLCINKWVLSKTNLGYYCLQKEIIIGGVSIKFKIQLIDALLKATPQILSP